MNRFAKAVLLLLLCRQCFITSAQQYIPDKDFGNCGTTRLFFNEVGTPELKTFKVLPDKKVLLGGNFYQTNSDSISIVLVQYLPNGMPDTSGFGINGFLIKRLNVRSFLNSLVLQADGKIIAAGYANTGSGNETKLPALYRLLSNGEMDTGFNSNGLFAMSFDGASAGSLEQAIVLPDETIIAAGYAEKVAGAGTDGIGLLKVKSNGTLDSLFGNLALAPGRTFLPFDSVSKVLLFSMNDQLVVPFLGRKEGVDSIFIVRLSANGQVDNSFGLNGIFPTGVRSENLTGLLQADGRLLLGGTLNEPGQVKRMQLLRYMSDLTPDPLFGNNGQLILPTIGNSNSDNVLHSLKQQADGKIILIGHRATMGSNNPTPIILRLLTDGQTDSSFNGTGNMQINTEFAFGWRNIDTTDSTNFIIARLPDFQLAKYVPDTTRFISEPVAAFEFIVEKQNVFFENRSKNAKAYRWYFGDGNISGEANPVHEFVPGQYTVKLETYTSCDFSSDSKTIEVKGLYKILPGVGPSTGLTITHIEGYGFTGNEKVKLRNGVTALEADTVFLDTSSHSLQANFRFRNAPVGVYDVIVGLNGCPESIGPGCDTIRFGFEIQPVEASKPWVQVNGPSVVRPDPAGRRAFFDLEYGFTGNQTQYLIPLALVIQGKDKTLYPELAMPLANTADTALLPDSLKPFSNGFYRLYDEISQDSVWVLFLSDVVVAPEVTNNIPFTVTQRSGDSITIRAFIGNTLFDPEQRDSLYQFRTFKEGCNDCLKCLLDAAGYIPGPVGCAAGIISLACSVSEFELTDKTPFSEALNLGLDFASTTVGCASLAGGTVTKLMNTFAGRVLDFVLSQKANYGFAKDCGSALITLSNSTCNPPGAETGRTVGMRKSIDPNTKVGPDGGNAAHYIGKDEQLVYTTQFENLPTATAPAYQVEITDTLDKAVMEISTFRFNRVSIAGVNYSVFQDKDSFALDIPMADKGIVVRTTGRIDTATGVATWKFVSLDAATMDIISDIDQGFLPPNTDSIEGTGAVSFSVQQKATNTHLTTIANQAKIVFDLNEPIFTPVWTNIVDTVRPQSQVLNSSFRVLTDSTFLVKWSGMDAHAGLRNYKVAISVNDSAYTVLGIYGADSTIVKGTAGSVYKFISLAKDSAGNIEEPPADALNNPDAVFAFLPALPLEMITFRASKENRTAKLEWTTAQEANTSHFAVEHSLDGREFSPIGTVMAAGNSVNKQTYSFMHRQPVNGSNHYRLKMIDRDGLFRYSPVRMVTFETGAYLRIKPNPAATHLTIKVAEPGGVVRLVNSGGRVVREIRIMNREATMDLTVIVPGIYIVSYTTKQNSVLQEKLVIHR